MTVRHRAASGKPCRCSGPPRRWVTGSVSMPSGRCSPATGSSSATASRTPTAPSVRGWAVRNSGAFSVVEGVGEHAAEYMTGGTLVILGEVGHNLGAGMTGGEVFVYDAGIRLPAMVNAELVDVHRLSGEHQLLLEQGLRLRELVERHAAFTGSAVAQAILQDWHGALHRFWRVAPKADVARIENQHEGTIAARG